MPLLWLPLSPRLGLLRISQSAGPQQTCGHCGTTVGRVVVEDHNLELCPLLIQDAAQATLDRRAVVVHRDDYRDGRPCRHVVCSVDAHPMTSELVPGEKKSHDPAKPVAERSETAYALNQHHDTGHCQHAFDDLATIDNDPAVGMVNITASVFCGAAR